MDKFKIGSLLGYISAKIPEITLRKLIKLVYLIDEESVKTRGLSVTWLNYYAWEKGPVAPCIYEVKNNGGLFADFVGVKKNEKEQNVISSCQELEDYGLAFSKKERRLIDQILEKYGQMTADELTDITHADDGLWQKATKKYQIDFEAQGGKSEVELNLADWIADDEEKMDVYEDARSIALL